MTRLVRSPVGFHGVICPPLPGWASSNVMLEFGADNLEESGEEGTWSGCPTLYLNQHICRVWLKKYALIEH
jgi:hypothetical protein